MMDQFIYLVTSTPFYEYYNKLINSHKILTEKFLIFKIDKYNKLIKLKNYQ